MSDVWYFEYEIIVIWKDVDGTVLKSVLFYDDEFSGWTELIYIDDIQLSNRLYRKS